MSALVYDIGLPDGRDTGHYLRERCRVVAIDANPSNVRGGRKDLTAGTSLSAIHPNALTVKRMPRVRHHDKLRSVC